MSNDEQHFYRVHMAEGESVVVLAVDEDGAKRVARAGRLRTGWRNLAARPVKAVDEGHAGSWADYCPKCRARAAAGLKPARRSLTLAELFDLGRFVREVPTNG